MGPLEARRFAKVLQNVAEGRHILGWFGALLSDAAWFTPARQFELEPVMTDHASAHHPPETLFRERVPAVGSYNKKRKQSATHQEDCALFRDRTINRFRERIGVE